MPATLRSILLFCLAAVAEIGGALLIWQGAREHRGVAFVRAGIVALTTSSRLLITPRRRPPSAARS